MPAINRFNHSTLVILKLFFVVVQANSKQPFVGGCLHDFRVVQVAALGLPAPLKVAFRDPPHSYPNHVVEIDTSMEASWLRRRAEMNASSGRVCARRDADPPARARVR